MREMSRREVLKIAAAGGAAVALGGLLSACKGALTSESSSAPGGDTSASGATETGTTIGTSASTGTPDLVVVRNGEPEPLVRAAVAALGGMGRFVPSGAKVVVKPNMCVSGRSYEYAATTNPWLVAAVVKMALEAGASSVKVLDYPFQGSPDDAYANSGIADQVQAAGGQMVEVSDHTFVKTEIPGGQWLKETDVHREVLNADVIINVPIAKHHFVTDLTLGMKNLMGVVLDRDTMHIEIDQAIADLSTLVKPALNIVDCTRILTGNGPQGGNLRDVKKLDTVIASTDIVAADSYATTLFGKQPRDITHIGLAADMGLGQCDLSKLNIKEISA
jgi:uncharacterized protein (DUF362 family)